MLNLIYGNKLEILADQLGELIGNQKNNDPLSPKNIIVQNQGMAKWLSVFLAERNQVAANYKFELPARRMWLLYRSLYPELPDTLPSDKEVMAWSIMKILGNLDSSQNFDHLRQYIHRDGEEMEIRRRWQLSQRLADVLDQYLVFRPEMIEKWEKGAVENWQASLWEMLRDYWQSDPKSAGLPHRAALHKEMMRALEKDQFPIDGLPNQLNIFGISNLPPGFIHTFVRLARFRDVNLFILNPFQSVDIGRLPDDLNKFKFDNPLLGSLSEEGIQFMSLIQDFAEQEGLVRTDDFRTKTLFELDPGNQNKGLGILQNDLIKNDDRRTEEPDEQFPIQEDDRSIQFHACHSPMREVEVLYDQLLNLFEQDETLSPSDILIMTPDIESYAPLIDAVFGTREEGLPHIPYSIADRGVRSESPSIETFMKLLELPDGRFKVTEIMDILDTEAIRHRFGFTEDDIVQLQDWILETRIRWGIDRDDRAREGLPEFESNTWRFGLNRLLLGYAMQQKDNQLFDSIYPFSDVEGTEQTELLGRFTTFMESLFDIKNGSRKNRLLKEWSELLQSWLQTFIAEDAETYPGLQEIRSALNDLDEYAELAQYDEPVPLAVIREYVGLVLQQQTYASGFLGRGVTFCAMMPMRSIPFRVIGMIGMNDAAFPRIQQAPGFDLIAKNPRKGDRSRRADDRYLFLEGILSARTHLYFSYVGRSIKDDSLVPPSVLISELQDYLEQSVKGGAYLMYEHRLQPFSTSYFKPDSRLISYSSQHAEVSKILMQRVKQDRIFWDQPLPQADEDWKNLSVDELFNFYKNPSRYLLQNRLHIRLDEEDILNEDREPFDLGGLEAYQLGNQLLEVYLKAEAQLGDYRDVAVGEGTIPFGWPGEEAYREKVEEVQAYGKILKNELPVDVKKPLEVDLEIGEFKITGLLKNISDNGLVYYRYGRLKAVHKMALWIYHLVYLLKKDDDLPLESTWIGQDNKDRKKLDFFRLGKVDNPSKQLEKLLHFYWKGLHEPIPFFVETSGKFAEEMLINGKKEAYAINRAQKSAFKNGYTPYPLEGDDPYVEQLFGNSEPLENPAFARHALEIWEPVFNHVKEH